MISICGRKLSRCETFSKEFITVEGHVWDIKDMMTAEFASPGT